MRSSTLFSVVVPGQMRFCFTPRSFNNSSSAANLNFVVVQAHLQRDVPSIVLVEDRQDPELPSVRQLVVDQVHRQMLPRHQLGWRRVHGVS